MESIVVRSNPARKKPAPTKPAGTPTAIEHPDFPLERLSEIAELESWRKEVNRPIYHVHKWWAQRLGSVFRSILLGAFSPTGTDILEAFYSLRRPSNHIIYD